MLTAIPVREKAIYVLRDPVSQEVRYVGATSTSVSVRVSTHMARCEKDTHLCAVWLRGLKALGLRPLAEIAVSASSEWQIAERNTIFNLRSLGASLLNQTDGGVGCHGCHPSAATRSKRSKSIREVFSDPKVKEQMAARSVPASQKVRETAAARMRSIWSDPEKAEQMRRRMRGAKARRKGLQKC